MVLAARIITITAAALVPAAATVVGPPLHDVLADTHLHGDCPDMPTDLDGLDSRITGCQPLLA